MSKHRVGKQSAKIQAAKEALDRFIEALTNGDPQTVLPKFTRTDLEVAGVSKKGQPSVVLDLAHNKSVQPSTPENHTPESQATWEDKARDFLEGVKWDG